MARPVIKYDEGLGGNLRVCLERHDPLRDRMIRVFFKKDYVAIFHEGCPDCDPWPYQAIFPTLHGKVQLVALFSRIGSCGTPTIRELIDHEVTVISTQESTVVGSRFGAYDIDRLPDMFAVLLATTNLVQEAKPLCSHLVVPSFSTQEESAVILMERGIPPSQSGVTESKS